MQRLGLDMGSATIHMVLMENCNVLKTWEKEHFGNPIGALRQGLEEIGVSQQMSVGVTGTQGDVIRSLLPYGATIEEIPAIVEGVRYLYPEAGSIIDIGSQSARFITDLDHDVPVFSTNEHCAGGTGSFFQDQMTRLGLKITDFSHIVSHAKQVPRISGRCAVFAKTDIIHRQQEGTPVEDILMGLCYAMVRNYKATIVKDNAVRLPVVFCGGVTKNIGVQTALLDVFGLKETDLQIPKDACYTAALGAALLANAVTDLSEWKEKLQSLHETEPQAGNLPPLEPLPENYVSEPCKTEQLPPEGCYLGIDIGSTSTNLVLIDEEDHLIDYCYLRTAGDGRSAVHTALDAMEKKYGHISFRAIGITGSGRERIGKELRADLIQDEITAQARAAKQACPDATAVFEIGGQDSKFIQLRNGTIVDFQMNKICAAGTGSFVEEQALRMNIPLSEFGPLALKGTAPANLGERCTVFIETAIAGRTAAGESKENIAAGLCHAIVRNYLHKVVGNRPVGEHVVLQGGVAYNPGIVAAFRSAYGNQLTVSPYFAISGAYGVALLAKEAIQNSQKTIGSNEIMQNKKFYQLTRDSLLEGYTGRRDPQKKTVGVPMALLLHKFFPMANAFFTSLGFNVVVSRFTDETIIHRSQEAAVGETCYPVKLIYGHFLELADQNVDYIFMPAVHTIKHPHSYVDHNYACVYMQTAAQSVFQQLGLEKRGIQLLNPLFDLDLGAPAMAKAMIGLGTSLGFSTPTCMKALASGSMAVKKRDTLLEREGKKLLESINPAEKVLVMITRSYGISDPVLNMGIPDLLLERGYKVINLDHLPGHSLNLETDYPNMYWPFGEHILSGAKLIANHPNLYAVYLTNHGCGPDSLITHMFQQEMGEKPYLQIEVDEHFSKVGVITRIEAFLNSISLRPTDARKPGFVLEQVPQRVAYILPKPEREKMLWLPDFGPHTRFLKQYYEAIGQKAEVLPPFSDEDLVRGRAETKAKEYLPFTMLAGSLLRHLETCSHPESIQFLIPFNEGAEADGQYAGALRTLLDRNGFTEAAIVAPLLEKLPQQADNFDLLSRCLLAGDLEEWADKALFTKIPEWKMMEQVAEELTPPPSEKGVLSLVGTPLSIRAFHQGLFRELRKSGYGLRRAPLSESLMFLWQDSNKVSQQADSFLQHIEAISKRMGRNSFFATDFSQLLQIADKVLPDFAGGNGRYRLAKAILESRQGFGVLQVAPRYENTLTILEMRNWDHYCNGPVFTLQLDDDFSREDNSRLQSFLYYYSKTQSMSGGLL